MNGPVLFTERLVLRPPAAEDFEAWADFHADTDTMRFLGGAQPRAAAWRSFCTMAGAWEIRGFAMFSLIERATGQWIGRAGPWMPEGWPGAEIAWGIATPYVGKGYAFEAAKAAIDYAVDVLGWPEVIHTIAPDNHRSQRLARRLGSANRGPTSLPPPMAEVRVDLWSQSAEDWRARREGLV